MVEIPGKNIVEGFRHAKRSREILQQTIPGITVRSEQGGKRYQQDTYTTFVTSQGEVMASVFDGFGSVDIARFVASEFSNREPELGQLLDGSTSPLAQIYDFLKDIQAEVQANPHFEPNTGTTVSGILAHNNRLFAYNTGDSSTVAFDREGNCFFVNQPWAGIHNALHENIEDLITMVMSEFYPHSQKPTREQLLRSLGSYYNRAVDAIDKVPNDKDQVDMFEIIELDPNNFAYVLLMTDAFTPFEQWNEEAFAHFEKKNFGTDDEKLMAYEVLVPHFLHDNPVKNLYDGFPAEYAHELLMFASDQKKVDNLHRRFADRSSDNRTSILINVPQLFKGIQSS